MKPFEIMGQRSDAEYRIDHRNPDQHPEYSNLSIEQYHVSKGLCDSKQLIIWKDVFRLLQSS